MTVETRWSGVTVTDWLEGEVPTTATTAAEDESRVERQPTRRWFGC